MATVSCVAPADRVLISFVWLYNSLFGHYTVRVTVLDRWNDCHEWTDGPYAPSVRKNMVETAIRNKVERLYGPLAV